MPCTTKIGPQLLLTSGGKIVGLDSIPKPERSSSVLDTNFYPFHRKSMFRTLLFEGCDLLGYWSRKFDLQ